MQSIRYQGTFAGRPYDVQYDRDPDKCPLCHHAVAPRSLTATFTGDPVRPDSELEIAYSCNKRECNRLFIGRYTRNTGGPETGLYALKNTAPQLFIAPALSDEIKGVSAAFVKIYAQASEAEARGLDDIAGVGYRKALEYLIKDYCIAQKPDEQAGIRKELLGQTIDSRIADQNLKNVAKRAAWLGNDETHYERRFIDKDMSDLKVLIRLSINYIVSDVLTKRYVDEMEPKK